MHLARSASAAPQSLASKPRFALVSLFLVFVVAMESLLMIGVRSEMGLESPQATDHFGGIGHGRLSLSSSSAICTLSSGSSLRLSISDKASTPS